MNNQIFIIPSLWYKPWFYIGTVPADSLVIKEFLHNDEDSCFSAEEIGQLFGGN